MFCLVQGRARFDEFGADFIGQACLQAFNVEGNSECRIGALAPLSDTLDELILLAEVATMKDVTWRTVSAEGYADSVGSAAYNQRLSERRAKAVRAFLLGKGLDPRMVEAQGKGAVDPVADNATAEGRAQNRRTEVIFTGVRTVASSS